MPRENRMLRIVDESLKGEGSKEEPSMSRASTATDELTLHKYKTAKHYGSAKVLVPKALSDAVHMSLDLVPRECVFANFARPGTPWTTKYMSNQSEIILQFLLCICQDL